jgi:hypothetical protein
VNDIPVYDAIFVSVTVVLVAIAAVLNLWAARETRRYHHRRMSLLNMRRLFTITGALAVVYVPFYVSVFWASSEASWSTFMLGFGIVAWIVPWIATPALYLIAVRNPSGEDGDDE